MCNFSWAKVWFSFDSSQTTDFFQSIIFPIGSSQTHLILLLLMHRANYLKKFINFFGENYLICIVLKCLYSKTVITGFYFQMLAIFKQANGMSIGSLRLSLTMVNIYRFSRKWPITTWFTTAIGRFYMYKAQNAIVHLDGMFISPRQSI